MVFVFAEEIIHHDPHNRKYETLFMIRIQWVLAILTFIMTLMDLVLVIIFQPFYRHGLNLLRALTISASVWASFCLLVVMGIDDHHNSISVMYFLLLPVVCLAVHYSLKLRKDYIKKTPISAKMNPFTVELKVHELFTLD